jgi:CMP-N,N'-diacetyllegionaminic acid synthase
MKILTIIPARSGSKGIPHKNIKSFNGMPLLVHSINQAKESKYYNSNSHQMKIHVSTDSQEYANIALNAGADVPFLRPDEISQDHSIDYEFIKYTLDKYKKRGYKPDIILQLRPTQPCRKVEDIDKCLGLFIDNIEKYDSLRTIVPFEKSPFKMYILSNDKLELYPLFEELCSGENKLIEPFNMGRQYLPQAYLHNGYIDILKSSIVDSGTISGNKIYPYVMDKTDTIDIDTEEDWIKAENQI